MIQNSQCKSIAMVLVTMLTLPQQSGMNNNMIMNNAMNFQNENATKQAEHSELLKSTLPKRLELLNELVNRCIATADKKDLEDLHNNFCYVINNLFLREFENKKDFIDYIIKNFYEELLETFLKSKTDNLGNKLGQVVYSITDTILNKAEKLELEIEESVYTVLSKYGVEMVKFVEAQSTIRCRNVAQRTYSSTQELRVISYKTYKIFEILNLILNQKSRTEPLISDAQLESSEIEKNLFRFYKVNPLNNILHNVVTSFIISIGNSKFEKIKKKLAQNEGFFELLEDVTKNSQKRVFRQQKCYLGHLKKLANFFSSNVLKSETDERWVNFRDEFLKEENEKENKALGDVYVNNENDDDGIMFCFTMEEIKEKYSVFLGFKTEEEEVKKIEEMNENNEEANLETEEEKTDESEETEKGEDANEGVLENTDNECKQKGFVIKRYEDRGSDQAFG